MTVPTSKLLKANKSLVATASLKHMSPNFDNSQQQSVSIVVNNSSPDLTKQPSYPDIDVNQQTTPTKEREEQPQDTKVVYEDNPYASIPRDLETAETNTQELSKLISEKDNIIKAQSLIIDMFQNNPLIVN